MQYTSNYQLKKQELTDKADITQISENWDTIDRELATVDGKSGGTVTGDVTIEGNLSTEGFSTKLDYIKGQTPETPKNATWNIFDSENNRVARVQFNISESGVPSIGMYVNRNNDASSEDATGVVCQWNDTTPRVSITHHPDKAANDKQIATTNWVKSQIATTSEYGLVKLADEQAFLMPKDPECAVNVPLVYEVNDFRRLNTAYEVGDRVACAFEYDLFLECTQAGTTSEEMLDTRNVTHGQVITDGTVQWTVRTHVRSINNAVADENGNVTLDVDIPNMPDLSGVVKSVNTVKPDTSGNVTLAANNINGLATVAKTGNYNDLYNKPSVVTDRRWYAPSYNEMKSMSTHSSLTAPSNGYIIPKYSNSSNSPYSISIYLNGVIICSDITSYDEVPAGGRYIPVLKGSVISGYFFHFISSTYNTYG